MAVIQNLIPGNLTVYSQKPMWASSSSNLVVPDSSLLPVTSEN